MLLRQTIFQLNLNRIASLILRTIRLFVSRSATTATSEQRLMYRN